jgi:hypothetical protein
MESSLTSAVDQQLPDYELLLQRAFFTKIQMVEVNREFGYLHFAFFIRAIFGSVVLLGFWDVCQIFLDGFLEKTVSWVFAVLWLSFVVWSVTAHLNLIRAKKHARRVAEAKTEDQYPLRPEQRGQVARESQDARSARPDAAKWFWVQPNT